MTIQEITGIINSWWTGIKSSVQNISSTWTFTKGAFGTTTAGNAQITTAAPTSSTANQIDTPGVAYTGTSAGARWNETTNNRVRGYLGSAFDYIKSVGNYLFQNSNSLNAVVSAGATGDLSAMQVQAAFTRYPTAVSYTVSLTDIYFGSIIAVTDTSAARTITLPAANSVAAGFLIAIVDESNAAGTNNISIALTGTDTTNVTAISTNGGYKKVYSDGTSKWINIS